MFRTLLVDDRDIFLTEIKRMHVWGEASGFQVAGRAHDGREALRLLRSARFDLVVTDIRMPVMNGIELLQAVKKESLCGCVVLLSEYTEFAYARQGLVLGAFDYMVKPLEERSLAELLGRAGKFITALQTRKAQTPLKEAAPLYPAAEEKVILRCLLDKSDRALEAFRGTAEDLFSINSHDAAGNAAILTRLYQNIVSSVFEARGWLKNYVHAEEFESTLPPTERAARVQDDCLTRLGRLLALLRRYEPACRDANIRKIYTYILENPEAEIRLRQVAEKFYVNHTYLSNMFKVKTGMRFNDFVTMVKMARARYLMENDGCKIYEISERLGYHDAEYFSRLYKASLGLTRSE